MEKKKYAYPVVELTVLSTRELMFTEGMSGDGTPVNPAPRRRSEVF